MIMIALYAFMWDLIRTHIRLKLGFFLKYCVTLFRAMSTEIFFTCRRHLALSLWMGGVLLMFVVCF